MPHDPATEVQGYVVSTPSFGVASSVVQGDSTEIGLNLPSFSKVTKTPANVDVRGVTENAEELCTIESVDAHATENHAEHSDDSVTSVVTTNNTNDVLSAKPAYFLIVYFGIVFTLWLFAYSTVWCVQ